MTTRPPGETGILRDLWVRANIMRRLVERYGLSDMIEQSDSLLMPRQVLGVTQMDRLLERISIELTTTAVAAGGWITAHTVPADERWTLRLWYANQASGNFQINGVRIGDGTNTQETETFTASTNQKTQFSGQQIELDRNWVVQVSITNFVGAGNLTSSILVLKEKAY